MYQFYMTNQHLGRFYKYTHSCAAYEPSFPANYALKSKALVKKVSINEKQRLSMGRVPI